VSILFTHLRFGRKVFAQNVYALVLDTISSESIHT
jgi:hypothetical protein